jgi:hypothetical protein
MSYFDVGNSRFVVQKVRFQLPNDPDQDSLRRNIPCSGASLRLWRTAAFGLCGGHLIAIQVDEVVLVQNREEVPLILVPNTGKRAAWSVAAY